MLFFFKLYAYLLNIYTDVFSSIKKIVKKNGLIIIFKQVTRKTNPGSFK
jgi:hypothetical protein